MTKAQEISSCFALLTQQYDREITDGLHKLWLMILGDLPDGCVSQAVQNYLADDRPFFPNVGVIRQMAFDLVDTDLETPEGAFADARSLARSVGADGMQSLSFEISMTTTETIRLLGGWRAFCLCDDELQWQRKRFIEVYAGVNRRLRSDRRELPSVTSFREQRQLTSRDAKKLLKGEET